MILTPKSLVDHSRLLQELGMLQEKESEESILHLTGKLSGDDDFYRSNRREFLSFTGSLIKATPEMRSIARLHNKITSEETTYPRKRRFIELGGYLSQWFEIELLDRVFSLLEKTEDRKESSEEEEIKKILAYIDVILRLDGNTIRWKTLTEISDYFLLEITRKSLYKYRYEAQKAFADHYGKETVLKKLLGSPVMLMKRLVVEFISHDKELDEEQKRDLRSSCYQLITTMNNRKFIPRDYEIYSFAIYSLIKQAVTGTVTKHNFPVDDPKFRRAVSNAIYKIKTRITSEKVPLRACQA
ncbi:MAG: hypothetical protein ACFFD4_26155 [Candidatus Odinarchaeota archaeon]